MKKRIQYQVYDQSVEREINYIPFRYILAIAITLFEVAAIIGILVALCCYVPYFYIAAWLTEIACVISIIASDDNPDYKVPWLLFLLVVPIVGFMAYFLFYSRKLKKKYVRRMKDLKDNAYERDDAAVFAQLCAESPVAHSQAQMLCKIAETHLFTDTRQTYESFGWELDDAYESLAGIPSAGSMLSLHLRRGRRIVNRVELTRLQRQFEACMKEIQMLEGSRDVHATICSLCTGIVGLALLLCAAFTAITSKALTLLGVLLALPGAILCALAYPIYGRVYRKREGEVAPLVDAKRAEICPLCEKGQRLTRA